MCSNQANDLFNTEGGSHDQSVVLISICRAAATAAEKCHTQQLLSRAETPDAAIKVLLLIMFVIGVDTLTHTIYMS